LIINNLTLFIGQSKLSIPCPIILKLRLVLIFPIHPEKRKKKDKKEEKPIVYDSPIYGRTKEEIEEFTRKEYEALMEIRKRGHEPEFWKESYEKFFGEPLYKERYHKNVWKMIEIKIDDKEIIEKLKLLKRNKKITKKNSNIY